MPINIIDYSEASEGESGKPLEGLCNDKWEMPAQIEALEKWLIENQSDLTSGDYVADIGFSPRPGAAGGGAVLSVRTMKIMSDIGMNLYLSEYPEFVDEE